ncbi:polysaccharide ABC transporter ATP-binding protein [Patescibacteria group bacterium]|nr:polysaccharide ABC transporter ATP-binding protein [Patescibacteria group bacterium]
MKIENAITVRNLYKSFKLPHEQKSGLKEVILNIFRRSNKNTRGYEIQHVLNDTSFDIKKGEFFGIVGRNGSGKSTLLKLLAGIYTPDRGSVEVNGSLTPFIELGVGFNPELTGRENVFLNGALLGFSKEEMTAMYDDIVTFAELDDFMDQKLKNYSSGMQVRLAFSIAIRAKSNILLLDEVLAVGDAAFQKKCFEYFAQLKKDKNTTIVFITHDMEAVKRFCDRAILIKKGKIILVGDPQEIADQYILENVTKDPNGHDENRKKQKVRVELQKKSYKQNENLVASVKYNYNLSKKHYVGITIHKNGYPVAELNSSRELPLSSSTKSPISLEVPLKNFNPSTYEITAAIFDSSSRTLLQYTPHRAEFIVRGYDEERGGPMRINAKWSVCDK